MQFTTVFHLMDRHVQIQFYSRIGELVIALKFMDFIKTMHMRIFILLGYYFDEKFPASLRSLGHMYEIERYYIVHMSTNGKYFVFMA